MAEAELQPVVDPLGRLVRELERRMRIEDPAGRLTLDAEIAELADQVAAALVQPSRADPKAVPPRRIAIALGLALHSVPHFAATLPRPHRDGKYDPGEPVRRDVAPVPVLTPEVYERALGLPMWEVDELREEIDRRTGKVLKQLRTVNWLWSFFGMPHGQAQAFGRILLPGSEETPLDIVRRGGHLYLLVDTEEHLPLGAMFLPWLASDPALGPASFQARAFQARGVDKGLRTRIARGIGADDEEVAQLLEEIVSVVPRGRPAPYLWLDQWRSHGYAVVTDLGSPYTAGDWLVRPIAPDGADWETWLRVGATGLSVKGTPEKVFDALALPRVTAMVRLLYAAILASVDRDGLDAPDRVQPEDVDFYDLPRHMRAVLAPLLGWAGKASTHNHLAEKLGRPVEEVTVVLEQIREAWAAHAASSWYGPPGTKTPSIQTLILEHLLVLHRSLRDALRRESDSRAEHGDTVLLFVAHYLREARLERLWVRSLSDVVEGEGKLPPPEDIVNHWFWRAWSRVLAESDHDGNSSGT